MGGTEKRAGNKSKKTWDPVPFFYVLLLCDLAGLTLATSPLEAVPLVARLMVPAVLPPRVPGSNKRTVDLKSVLYDAEPYK